MNKLFVFVVFATFFMASVFATDIVYVVKNPSMIQNNVLLEIEGMNLSYKIIDDSKVPGFDFSDYGMILLGDGRINGVPTEDYKMLIMNPNYYEGWSGSVGSSTSNLVFNLDSAITNGIPSEFNSYVENGEQIYYLTGAKFSESVTVKSESSSGRGKFVVAKKENPRRIFFGLINADYWSVESKDLFSNSIFWLLSGEDSDGDGFYYEDDCDDSNFDVNPNATDIPYNGIDEDCSGGDLVDVDLDGFDSDSVGGDDCDDGDFEININGIEVAYNGVDEDCSGEDLVDVDGDGFDATIVGGDDCDDGVFEINIDAIEIAYNGIDEDCSGRDLVDVDGDGFDATIVGGDDCDDEVFEININGIEVAYNGVDEDCSGEDLVDVDGDGFDATIVGGDDCDDEVFDVNVDSDNFYKNCINDAPVIVVYDEIVSVTETENATIIVEAMDFEGDSLTYLINDSRFVEDDLIEGKFVWKTGYYDYGNYFVNVSVFDEEFYSSVIIEVVVGNQNQGPICEEIPDVEWDEDENHTIDLSDYCYDLDPLDSIMFYFNDTSSEGDISLVNLDSDSGVANFSSSKDWSGEDWIIFKVFDGKEESLTNRITLRVLGVNDAPELLTPIENISWEEDTNLTNYINLNDYFEDIDFDELYFGVDGNSSIGVEINNESGQVSFLTTRDWFGVEEVVFSATDSLSDYVYSNSVVLNVSDANEPPEFGELDCDLEILEDEEYVCELNGTDFEGDNISFMVISQGNMECSVESNMLTYQSVENYNGGAGCDLRIYDDEGYSDLLFEVNVLGVNDAPVISSHSPEDLELLFLEGRGRFFQIEGDDVDDISLDFSWFLDSNKESGAMSYVFNEPKGLYNLRAVVSDGELNDSLEWSIVVGEISEFTCGEVSGDVCSEEEMCSVDYLGVSDSEVCCPISCVDIPPKFSDSKKCSSEYLNLSNEIKINIEDPRGSDSFEPGEELIVDLSVENMFSDVDYKFDILTYFYDIEREDKIKLKKESINVDSGGDKSVEFSFDISEDIEAGEYAVFVRVMDDDETVCNEEYVLFDVDREDSNVVIGELVVEPVTAMCGESVFINAKIKNEGTDDQDDVVFGVEGLGLDFDFSTEEFKLDEHGKRRSKKSEFFEFNIPKDTEAGEYQIKASVVYDNERERVVEYVDLSVECDLEVGFENNNQGAIQLGGEEADSPKKQSFFEKMLHSLFSVFR